MSLLKQLYSHVKGNLPMFTDIYKKLLAVRSTEISIMISKAVQDQNLRMLEKQERYLLLLSPGNVDGKRVLHLSVTICTYNDGYSARSMVESYPEAFATPDELQTQQWWCSKSKAGVHGFAFAKMRLGAECYLRYIPIENWGNHDTRAYRVYWNPNGIGFDMVRSDQSYWVDHREVYAVGALSISSRNQNNITILKTQADINNRNRGRNITVRHNRPKLPSPHCTALPAVHAV